MYVFVVPTYRRTDMLARCLDTLRLHEPDFSRWKAVIVHDGGPEEARRWISARLGGDPQIRLVLDDRNRGFSKAVNAGIAIGLSMGADRIVVTNDDVEFFAPIIDAAEAAFGSDPAVGIVGAKLLFPGGMIQHGGMHRSGSLVGHRFLGMASDHPPANVPSDRAVTGALMALRADMVRAIGGLDEGYFMGCEDVDYCLAAMGAGWRVLYWPSFSAFHAEGASRGRTDKEKGPVLASAERAGYRRLRSKWGHLLRERIKTAERPPVFFLAVPGTSGTCARAMGLQAAHLRLRGWDAEFWSAIPGAAPPAPGRRFDSADQAAGALKSLRGVKIAGGWQASQAVLSSIAQGDSGFIYVQDLEERPDPGSRQAILVACKNGLRPMCESASVGRALGGRFGAEPAIIGRAAAEEFFAAYQDHRAYGRIAIRVHAPEPGPFEAASAAFRSGGAMEGAFGLVSDGPGWTDATAAALLGSSLVYVHPHTQEGAGMLLLEAMAAGAAVVAVRSEAAESICTHEADCLMVREPAELPAAAARLLREPGTAARLAVAARKAALGYRVQMLADRIEDVFDQCPVWEPQPPSRTGRRRSMAQAPGPLVPVMRPARHRSFGGLGAAAGDAGFKASRKP